MTSRDLYKGYSGKADIYYRPPYPEALIDYLAQALAASPGRKVADIGCGTGIFTRQLAPRADHIYAIEPNQEMAAVCARECATHLNISVVPAVAEATGLADHGVDWVIAASAFHLFESAELFRRESRRILRPGGRAAIIWNNFKDQKCRFNQRLLAFLDTDVWGNLQRLRVFFAGAPSERIVFDHDFVLTREQFLSFNLSSAAAPRKGEDGYEVFLDELENLFAREAGGNGRIVLPHQTSVFIGEL